MTGALPWTQFIALLLQTVAILITAYFASRGLHAWREQQIGKRKVEVAEEALLATYKVRDALGFIRSPGAFGTEGKSRKRDASEKESAAVQRDMYFVPLERVQNVSDEFAQFQKARLLCEVYFGSDARKPFDAVMSVRWKVIVAARMLISTVGEGIAPKLREEWEERIWAGFSGSGSDPLAEAVDSAVRDIEALCRPRLKSGGDGSGWFQRLRNLAWWERS